jgi:hypothetical protein
MKPKQILAFLVLFLLITSTVQSLIELTWKSQDVIEFFKGAFYNTISLFFALIVAIPITVLILKKNEKNGQ